MGLGKSVYIIGNGPSREGLDLLSLKNESLSPIYGCNAVYRDFEVDKLFAIDDVIIKEILSSDFPKDKFVRTDHQDQFEPQEWNPNRPRENTGMIAMKHAIVSGFNALQCYGIDFVVNDYEINMGNVYSNTNGYGVETQCSFPDTFNRFRYFEWFTKKYSSVNFNFYFPGSYKNIVRDLSHLKNVEVKYHAKEIES